MMRQKLLLVDTNVWLDYYLPHRAGFDAAVELVRLCKIHEDDIALLVTPSTLTDFFFILHQEFKRLARESTGGLQAGQAQAARQATWGCLENLRGLVSVAGADTGDVWMACKYQSVHNDFEDNMVLAVATRCQVDYLVTNDSALLGHAPVPALSSAAMLALLCAEGLEG